MHPKGAAPFSSGKSHPRLGVPLRASERSKASARHHARLSEVGPPSQRRPPRAGSRLTPQGQGTRSTTGTFAFSFPVLFRFFSLNLRKQVLRRQRSGIGLPGPKGHARIPTEGAAGGVGWGAGLSVAGPSDGSARGRAGMVQPQRFTQPAGKIHFFHLGPLDEGVVHEHLQICSLCWVLN